MKKNVSPGGFVRNGQLPGRVQAKEVAPYCILPLAGSELSIVFIRTTGRNKAAPVICRNLVYHKAGLHMAEREGFEPSRPVSQPTRLAGERLQPLGHLSTRGRYSISQEGVVAILSGRSQRQAPRLWRQTSSAETRTKRRCTMASDRENAVEHQRFKTSDASRRGT